MKTSFNISTKIWLSISILILGYFFSMVVGFVLGQQTETSLDDLSKRIFPAARQSQTALAAFDEQLKFYEDAVMAGEVFLIESARKKSAEAHSNLFKIIELTHSSLLQTTIRQTLNQMAKFNIKAAALYLKMSSIFEAADNDNVDNDEYNRMTEELPKAAYALHQESTAIRKHLDRIATDFSERLKIRLSIITEHSRRQRYLNLILFFVLVSVALSLMALIISRSITRPLKKTLMLEKAVKESIDGIAITDLNGGIQFVNQAWARMHGFKIQELSGGSMELFYPENKAQFTHYISKVKQKGAFSGETRHQRQDGSIFPVMMTLNLLKDKNISATGLVTIARDITRQKKNQEKLHLINQDLQHAKDDAENATKSKSEFLANMSHEIRTPLNGIIAAADLALGEKCSPVVKRYFNIIHSSAYTLLGLINDILDFSKIEAGKLELEIQPFNLENILNTVIEMFTDQAAQKKIELVVDLDVNAPMTLLGDQLRIKQILINLIGNAMKFTHEGLIVVGVRCLQQDDSCVRIKFFVKDSGVGIPAEKLDYLFEAFTQADTSTTRKFGGTGLGLSICKLLVEIMGGTIVAESEPKYGSTFSFNIDFEYGATLDQKYMLPNEIRRKSFLVVDDCTESRIIIQTILESFGTRVKSVSSGQEALEVLSSSKDLFQLVMLDWLMPVLDGLSTSIKIRTELKLEVPIVMMTAFGNEHERRHAKAAGVNAFLSKPVSPSILFNTILDVFGKDEFKITQAKKLNFSFTGDHFQGIRILVAEDNLTNQEIIAAVLNKINAVIKIVPNGIRAVKEFEQGDFDVILMDIQMPMMDGYAATQAIRSLEGQKTTKRPIPIIAMTAYAMKGDKEKCLAAGMDGYVAKPLNQKELFNQLGQSFKPTKIENQDDQSLPGIDLNSALTRLQIKLEDFKKILHGFFKNNQDTIQKIKKAQQANDIQLLRQIGHSLKGSSRNIGAYQLGNASQILEDAASTSSDANLDAIIETLSTALQQVLTSLESLEPVNSPQVQVINPNQSEPIIKNLITAIASSDPVDIENNFIILKKHVPDLEELEGLLSDYNYDTAREYLQEMIPCQKIL